MIFDTHDIRRVLNTLCLLMNSGPPSLPEERLRTVTDLQELMIAGQVSGVSRLRSCDLLRTQELRGIFHAVFATDDTASAARMINAVLNSVTVTPQVTFHDGQPAHLHFFPDTADLFTHLASDGAMALALMLTSGNFDRLRVCTSSGCARAFVDYSRNGCRLYCDSRTCGNRTHAASYRQRMQANRLNNYLLKDS